MVKELAQRRTAVGASGLLPVDGVQGLVDKQAHGTQQVRPERSLREGMHVKKKRKRKKTHQQINLNQSV